MATKLAKNLPNVQAVKVDDKGRQLLGGDDSPITKNYTGQQWKLMGSNPKTNGGWQVVNSETPAEIVATGNLTGATMGDQAGSGIDGKNQDASHGKIGDDIDTTQADDQSENATKTKGKVIENPKPKKVDKDGTPLAKTNAATPNATNVVDVSTATEDDDEVLDVTSKIA